jgi:hypothetical protein
MSLLLHQLVRAAGVRLFLVAVALPCARGAGAESPTFNRDIRPLLSDRCFACHGPDGNRREAELRLDTEEGAHAAAVVPGDPENSEIWLRITSEDPVERMPPSDSKKPPLSPVERELIRQWIDAGAKYEPHWAYILPRRPQTPTPQAAERESEWDSPIDELILARLRREGVTPSPEADRVTLARRVYLDLTGLPPTPDDIDAFLDDERPDAYERLVDRLLASEAYGERMASWWFDLVRFASTVGYHGDQEHHVLPYRDYVIKAFNDNIPFDQFTIEQLAGDLLPAPTMWQKVASGYNRLLQTTHEGGAQDEEYRAKHLADRVRNYSETWLGASMGCSECHDHKFDPYTQDDFYSLGAFFADVDHYGSFEPISSNTTPTERPPEMLAWTLPVSKEAERLDAEIAKLDASLTGVLKGDWKRRRSRLLELKQKRVEIEGKFVPAMITKSISPREVHILPRGNWMDRSGAVVAPHTPHFLRQIEKEGERATRLDLARWTVSRENPLTARVTVNRLWQRYFGVGLSKTAIDLGSQGECPPNQDLLDWLAVEFMDSGWNIKHMIRLIVTSKAYRQSSAERPDLAVIDPENRLIARQASIRLDAEEIRDNALAVSGLLVQKVGGEASRPYQPARYYETLNFPTREYQPTRDERQFRRAVYVHWQRQFLHPWLLAFDAPTREECTAQRPLSNTPTAALVLLNDPSYVEAARALASRALNADCPTDVDRAAWTWRLATGRRADAAEIEVLVGLLEAHRKHYRDHEASADELTSIGMTPRPKEADLPELAAWTSVCRVLLNLSETITRN